MRMLIATLMLVSGSAWSENGVLAQSMPSEAAIQRAVRAAPLKESTVTLSPPEHYVVEVAKLPPETQDQIDRIEAMLKALCQRAGSVCPAP